MKHFCSFSEAIREGAKLRPQHFGGGMGHGRDATCAYIAGIEAVAGNLSDDSLREFGRHGGYTYLVGTTRCPVQDCSYAEHIWSRLITIFHLNDDHRWTREQIADWLESEEEKLGFVTISESVASSSESPELAEVTV